MELRGVLFRSAVAISKIEPRIGPIQGVHPTPNAIPSNKELSVRDGVNRLNRRFVAVRNNGRRNMPKRDTPKIMINTPALYSSQRRHANKNCPPHPNAVPNKINNSEKPKTKQAAFTITWNLPLIPTLPFCAFFVVTPEIAPRYAGISGNVQGARNVNTPAKKDGMISMEENIMTPHN